MKWIQAEEIAAAVKNLRSSAGFLQRTVADALGYSRSAYSYKEAGKIAFTLTDLQMLAGILDIPPDVFFHPELFSESVEKVREVFSDPDHLKPTSIRELSANEQGLISMLRLYKLSTGNDSLLERFLSVARKEFPVPFKKEQ